MLEHSIKFPRERSITTLTEKTVRQIALFTYQNLKKNMVHVPKLRRCHKLAYYMKQGDFSPILSMKSSQA